MHFEDELRSLMKERSGSRKGWLRRCPEDLQLTAYVDGGIDEATRQSLEKHLSDCPRCLGEVSFLARAREWPAAEDVPSWLLTKAARLSATPPNKSFRFDWRWATAAAAVSFGVLLVILFAVRFRTPNSIPERAGVSAPEPTSSVGMQLAPSPKPRNPDVVAQSSPAVRPPNQKREPSAPVTRNSATKNGLPNLLSPHDGSVLKRGAIISFSWQKVPEVAFYDVSIMTTSGDLVISRQSEAESLDLPDNLPLRAGAKYFVSVRAHLRDGRTIRSSVVSFRVDD